VVATAWEKINETRCGRAKVNMATDNAQLTENNSEGNGKSTRFRNAMWISSVLSVLLLGVIFLVYRAEIRALSRAFFTVHSVRLFVNTKAPNLLKDYPFDVEKPPTFSTDLFLRYCKARTAIGAHAKPLLDDLPLLEKMSVTNSFANLRTASVELTPVLNDVQALFVALEPILRENKLSIQEFRWVAIQSWGMTAKAMQAGDTDASKEVLEEKLSILRLLKGKANGDDTAEMAAGILKELGTEFNVSNSENAWKVMKENWTAWASCEIGPQVDVGMVRGWKELKNRIKTDVKP
jgi:hypothetical protein